MKLLLIRHAAALPVGGGITRDADRPLNVEGEAAADAVGAALGVLVPHVAGILVSPLRRAKQTGERLSRGFRQVPWVRETENLAPGFRHDALLEELLGANEVLAAVGHQPDLGYFLASLIADGTGCDISMKPGTVCCCELSGSPANYGCRLEWVLPPDVIMRLHSSPAK
jgi:phosphohistidine phosphatase